MPLNLDSAALRALEDTLRKTGAALVRSEYEVSHVLHTLNMSPNGEWGVEVRIREMEFAGGEQRWPPLTATDSPVGAYYHARPGYVLDCWAPVNFHIHKHWHPDVYECIFVRDGEMMELISGQRIRTGEGMQIARGQLHEFVFILPTSWTHCFGLMYEKDSSGEAGEHAQPDGNQGSEPVT